MSVEILLPAMSPTMTEGNIAKWTKKEGEKVSPGDVIAEIETDKAIMELETDEDGVLGKILIAEGSEGIAVGTLIAVILEDGESESVLDGITASVVSVQSVPPSTIAIEAHETIVKAPVMISPSEAVLPEGTGFSNMTVREALRDAMAEEMRLDDSVFVIGEERVIDTPITEHGFAGLGVGAAMANLKPVVEFMTFNFAMQAIDQIVNSAAKTNYMSGGQIRCPIVFRGPNGAAARVGAQHSQNYASWYAHIPGLIVIAPYSAADCKGLLKAAIKNPNPVIFLENEITYGYSFDVPDMDDYTVPIGKASVVRSGSDVTLVAYSIGVKFALDAAEKLASDGIDAEVIDLRTIRPLDMETIIESVKKTNRVVCVEEGWATCSVSSEISARLMEGAFDYLDAPVTRVTNEDVPMPYAANLEKLAVVNDDRIVSAAKAVCYKEEK